ncbi:MAG: hypothetical protein BBJ57_05200 [Desulfobacterales bacterium PC51MH44]|nr:MAG: hypothetical protein BBJ57_05200 [Desulfobacterales bacterium PC51MH44]
MKIWIDLTNSPHVNFFAGMIMDLQKDHDVLLTCRPLANTIELLDIHALPYHIIGKHYGKSIVNKTLGFIIRICQLLVFLCGKNIDVAISHSSFYSPVVAWFLGIRSIYLNDNEHAQGNRVSFVFADKIMVPKFLDIQKVQKQWAGPEKIIQYPGVKEGIYLWDYKPSISDNFEVDDKEHKKIIFIRPEPWTAQYYKGERSFIDQVLMQLRDIFSIVLLPRGDAQKDYYRQEKFTGITVLEQSISLSDIVENCDLFIGAGGTMTREAAVLGIPTISIYQDELLDVDNFLIEKGFMIHEKKLDAEFVVNFLEDRGKRPPDKQLLHKGKQAYELIKKTLLSNLTTKERTYEH